MDDAAHTFLREVGIDRGEQVGVDVLHHRGLKRHDRPTGGGHHEIHGAAAAEWKVPANQECVRVDSAEQAGEGVRVGEDQSGQQVGPTRFVTEGEQVGERRKRGGHRTPFERTACPLCSRYAGGAEVECRNFGGFGGGGRPESLPKWAFCRARLGLLR